MTEWLGNCQEKFYYFAGCIVKSMGQREIQPFDKLPGTMPGTGRAGWQLQVVN
jgi:hypothetical protein